ncbi:hypothetical protein [Acinetobacter indicus]|uniref:hypothetical protein n=1 Tax=Acinetobacter indicus TaxID=756892 RepID=UPI000948AB01|nr:hypothetical protein [Acinetobacter indicus]MCO8088548.1 hypothetical protein [Acinetobacter indicus]MDM1286780.1 hypothetical protein [Acinetobacter indicus]QIZ62159.1 hypothetical protein FK538_09110 [Acinetobacter indicus]
MKFFNLITLTAAILMTGCASKVTTYDSNGRMIGSCEAQTGFVIGGGAHCEGRANQEGRSTR